MRQRILEASVLRRLPAGTRLTEAVVMWQRHHLMVPFSIGVGVIVGLAAWWVGFAGGSAVGVGAAAGALGAAATTEHRILAATDDGLHLLRAGRLRRVAVAHLEHLPDRAPVELVSNQFVITEWKVGDRRFTVPKSSESAMTRIALSRA